MASVRLTKDLIYNIYNNVRADFYAVASTYEIPDEYIEEAKDEVKAAVRKEN